MFKNDTKNHVARTPQETDTEERERGGGRKHKLECAFLRLVITPPANAKAMKKATVTPKSQKPEQIPFSKRRVALFLKLSIACRSLYKGFLHKRVRMWPGVLNERVVCLRVCVCTGVISNIFESVKSSNAPSTSPHGGAPELIFALGANRKSRFCRHFCSSATNANSNLTTDRPLSDREGPWNKRMPAFSISHF